MGIFGKAFRSAFEEKGQQQQESDVVLQADVRMISGCKDSQTSADVGDVGSFQLPSAAGRAGGACTSTMLSLLYKDEEVPEEDYTFVELLKAMQKTLRQNGFDQIPQLTSSKPVDVNSKFDLVPEDFSGNKLALMIGINYTGTESQLSGCHNDVWNMATYIKNVHGFEEENITILMDDGKHQAPTKDNIVQAMKQLAARAEPGDSVFFHYSGHGCSVKDQNGDELDGKDEALCPVDCDSYEGLLVDDDIVEYLVKPLPSGVSMFCVCDCCHSGTILDLPYTFKADGKMTTMELADKFKNLAEKFGGGELVSNILTFAERFRE